MKQENHNAALLSGDGWTIKNMVGMALLVFAAIFLAITVYVFNVVDSSEKQSEEVSNASAQTADLMNQLGSQISRLKQQDLVLMLETQNLVNSANDISNAVFLYVNQLVEDSSEMDESYAKLSDSLVKVEKIWPSGLSAESLKLLKAEAQVIKDIIEELEATSSPSQLEEMNEDVNSFSAALKSRSAQIKNLFSKRIEEITNSIQVKSQGTLEEAIKNGESTKKTSALMGTLKGLIIIMSVIIIIFLLMFWVFVNKVISNPVTEIISCIKKLAEGDLTARVKLYGKTELVKLSESLNSMGDNLHKLVSMLSTISEDVAESSRRVTQSSEKSSEDMVLQSTETEQIASSIEQLTATSVSVAENSEIASNNAEKASKQAMVSSSVVKDVTVSIGQLSGNIDDATNVVNQLAIETNSIGSVLDVIRGISEQTNLLALNAAIEAARAGEQGRGFAVVADEVRTLASRTHDSTEEIQKMILSLQNGAQNAVKVMEQGRQQASDSANKGSEAVTELKQTTDAICSINDINHQIALLSNEQKQVIQNVVKNVHRISVISDNTTDGAKNTAVAAKKLNQMAIDQRTAISRFILG